MVRPAFDIMVESAASLLGECSLFIEVNEKQLTFVWIHPREKLIVKLKQFHAALHPEETVTDLLKELLATDEYSVSDEAGCTIIYNFAETTLAPAAFHSLEANKALSDLSFGLMQKSLVLSDRVESWDLYTVYRIPREIHSLLQGKFRSGKYWHFNSLILAGLNKKDEEAILRLYFYPDKFTLLLLKGEQLLQLQTYFYQVPEDVAFYLLSSCQLHGLRPDNIKVQIAGLIESDSALYHELGRYFMNLQWLESDWQKEPIGEFPAHYFSPLVDMSTCV